MIAFIAFLIGAGIGGAVCWSLGFDLGWQGGGRGRSAALAEAESKLADIWVAHEAVCLELDTIRAGRSAAGRKAWQTRKANATLPLMGATDDAA